MSQLHFNLISILKFVLEDVPDPNRIPIIQKDNKIHLNLFIK